MATIHAVFEKGVFRPTTLVQLPEAAEVEFEPRLVMGHSLGIATDSMKPLLLTRPQLTLAEFARNLTSMATMGSGQSLPSDFSRADIYDDHD